MFSSTVATFQDNSSHGEDNFLLRDLGDNSFMDAVMDGVTGHGGEEASQSVVDALAAATINGPDDIVAALEAVNQEFFEVGGGRFLLTTVSIILYHADKLHVISAGDSPVFHIIGDSTRQITGRMGGFLHVGVAKAIGAMETLTNLARTELPIEPGTRLVLATDGVTDNMLVEELADIVRGSSSPDVAANNVNGMVESRLGEGGMPEQLGRRFRHDDRTAIFRCFPPDA
ncbi:MAG: SpoIIE family protein phosphatase [Dehalococcoidia bacterium]|nr:SpoIIE family protein phosphatase [Dehalococcoidia bacterium]